MLFVQLLNKVCVSIFIKVSEYLYSRKINISKYSREGVQGRQFLLVNK